MLYANFRDLSNRIVTTPNSYIGQGGKLNQIFKDNNIFPENVLCVYADGQELSFIQQKLGVRSNCQLSSVFFVGEDAQFIIANIGCL